LGYYFGAQACLYATAMDKRITGVASFSGFSPLRSDNYVSTGGIARWYEWYGIQPRLGFYKDRQSRGEQ